MNAEFFRSFFLALGLRGDHGAKRIPVYAQEFDNGVVASTPLGGAALDKDGRLVSPIFHGEASPSIARFAWVEGQRAFAISMFVRPRVVILGVRPYLTDHKIAPALLAVLTEWMEGVAGEEADSCCRPFLAYTYHGDQATPVAVNLWPSQSTPMFSEDDHVVIDLACPYLPIVPSWLRP